MKHPGAAIPLKIPVERVRKPPRHTECASGLRSTGRMRQAAPELRAFFQCQILKAAGRLQHSEQCDRERGNGPCVVVLAQSHESRSPRSFQDQLGSGPAQLFALDSQFVDVIPDKTVQNSRP